MRRPEIESQVISTLVYYSILGKLPLTSFEIHSRLNSLHTSASIPTFSEITTALTSLLEKGVIREKSGFFYLKHSSQIPKRITNYKTSIKKMEAPKNCTRHFTVSPIHSNDRCYWVSSHK